MIGKKYSLILVTFLSLLFLSHASFAEIYSWVDENGRKHFGDKIPTKYQSDSKVFDLKETNTVSISESNKSISNVLGNSEAKTPVKKHKEFKKTDSPSKQKKEKKKSECSVQFATYKESQRCYSSCINAGGGINKSKCSHCTDIPRPRCNLEY